MLSQNLNSEIFFINTKDLNSHQNEVYDFSCSLLRTSDMLHLQFYFVNMILQKVVTGNEEKYILKKTTINKDKHSYMVVCLPQQHVAEELLKNDTELNEINGIPTAVKKSFVAGNSFLSFEIPDSIFTENIGSVVEFLLSWNRFKLLTSGDVKINPNQEFLVKEKDYPPLFFKDSFSDSDLKQLLYTTDNIISQTNGDLKKIPVTLFEVPYKIFLSPIVKVEIEEKEGSKENSQKKDKVCFLFDEMYKEKQYLKNPQNTNSVLIEFWNTSLRYKRSTKIEGPDFKILGYSGFDNNDTGVELQPSPIHRGYLAHLTNIPSTDDSRNIEASMFNISSTGTSEISKYSNYNPVYNKDNYSIVEWEQEKLYGRDNKDVITARGIDANTGLKLLVSIISERRINKGTSYLLKRYFVRYLDKFIEFKDSNDINRMPLKKIIPLDKGKYYTPFQLGNKNAYAVIKESGTYPADLIKWKYKGIDQNDNEHYFEMDIMLIPSEVIKITKGVYSYSDSIGSKDYVKGDLVKMQHTGLLDSNSNDYEFSIISFNNGTMVLDAVNEINSNKAANNDYHLVKFENKLAFAKGNTKNYNEKNINTELETDGVFFYTYINWKLISNGTSKPVTPKFEDLCPLLPRLCYANAYIPQLQGIETFPELHKIIYSSSYAKNGFDENENPAQLFVNMLKSDFELKSIAEIVIPSTKDDLNVDPIQEEIIKEVGVVRGGFTKNFKNIGGGLLNPDIEIGGLSLREQATIFKEGSKKIGEMSIKDFCGIDAEILGFKLERLFQGILKEADLPITKVLEDKISDFKKVEELLKAKHKDIFEAWEQGIKDSKKVIEEYPALIAKQKQLLLKLPGTEVLTLYNKYLTKIKFLWRSKIVLEFKTYQTQLNHQKEIFSKIIDQEQSDLEKKRNELVDTQSDLIRALKKIKSSSNDSYANYQVNLKIVETEFKKIIKSPLPAGYNEEFKYKAIRILYGYYFLFVNENYLFDLKPIVDLLKGLKNEIEKEYNQTYKIVLDCAEYVYQMSDSYLELVKEKTYDDLDALLKKIENLPDVLRNAEATSSLNQTTELYKHEYGILKSRKDEFENILKELKVDQAKIDRLVEDQEEKLEIMKKDLFSKLNDSAGKVFIEYRPRHILDKYEKIFQHISDDVITDVKVFESKFKVILEGADEEYNKYLIIYDEQREKIVRYLKELEGKLVKAKQEIEKPFEDLVKDFNKVIRERKKELEKLVLSNGDLQKIRGLEKEIRDLEKIINSILAPQKKEIQYSFKSKNLSDIDAGFAKLITNQNPQSELSVDLKAVTIFKPALPLEIEKTEISLVSSVSNIGINFLDLVTVNFDELLYENGTYQKNNFSVKVKDIQFDGALKFISAFESYMKKLAGGNIILNIDPHGVNMGFQYPIGNLTFGYFNLFNLQFNVFFHLPFEHGKSLQVMVGVNNPNNRFIVTVNGFPGSGYFLITLDPKKGVVEIAFLIEFGAHLRFNLGVASGHAYLYAGIYYLKKYDTVEIVAYIICSGRFRVLGLFNASIVFNLRLTSHGGDLEGTCTVKVSYRFSRWFRISANVSMHKKLVGSHNANSSSSSFAFNSFVQSDMMSFTGIIEDGTSSVVETNFTAIDNFQLGDELFVFTKIFEGTTPNYRIYVSNNLNKYERDFVSDQNNPIYEDKINKQYYMKYSITMNRTGSFSVNYNDKKLKDIRVHNDLVGGVSPSEEYLEWEKYFTSYYRES